MAAVKRKVYDEVPEEQPKVIAPPPSLEKQILDKLGTPPNLYKMQIINVGDQRWRANVRVTVPGTNTITITKIAHSYYLKTDEKGKIVGGDEIVATYKA